MEQPKHATTQISFEKTMLIERSQMKKIIYCIIPFTWNIQKRQTYREWKQVPGAGGGVKPDWK